MTTVTLAPGDLIEISLENKTYAGVIRDVIQSGERSYLLTLDSSDPDFPIKLIRVENKLTVYLGF